MEWLKAIHVSCVILSFSGFCIRGFWALTAPDKLKNYWVRRVPHFVDTLLLTSALLMLYVMSISVLENSWLMAKIVALLVYILLGMLALKPGRSKQLRGMAWFCGMLVFAYIASVALTKSVSGFFLWLS